MSFFFEDTVAKGIRVKVMNSYEQCSAFYQLASFGSYEFELLQFALSNYKDILDECIQHYKIQTGTYSGYQYLKQLPESLSSLKNELSGKYILRSFDKINDRELYFALDKLTFALGEVLKKACQYQCNCEFNKIINNGPHVQAA